MPCTCRCYFTDRVRRFTHRYHKHVFLPFYMQEDTINNLLINMLTYC